MLKLQPKTKKEAAAVPAQHTLWNRLTLYCAIGPREKFLYRSCEALDTTYPGLQAAMKRKTAALFRSTEMEKVALVTGTDLHDLLNNNLYLVAREGGGYLFLPAEEIVLEMQGVTLMEQALAREITRQRSGS